MGNAASKGSFNNFFFFRSRFGIGIGIILGIQDSPGDSFSFRAKIILKKRLENIEKSSSENFLKLRFEYELGARVHTLILESSASTVFQIISPFD